ncbi:hypothetical protein ACKVMH_10125 [Lysobacter zhanggongensis]|uniref:Uncharacterized protein n=1 Tax=Lysobacter zhanggongensis TaxID=1774951 RepID=A0ABU7YRQ3_9GAMM
MLRRGILLLLALATVSCSGGRVAVTLDHTSIRVIDHATLFPESPDPHPDRPSRQVLQLNISSQTDLLKYFGDRHTQLQVRCSVDGNTNGRAYNGFAIGPIPEGKGAIPHRYTIYSFIGLEADEAQYENGKPASTLNLKADRFQALKCHLIGVQKAPVPFPRSNDFVVSASTFHELLRGASKR